MPPDQAEILATVLGYDVVRYPDGCVEVPDDPEAQRRSFTLAYGEAPTRRLSCGHRADPGQVYVWFDWREPNPAYTCCLACAQRVTDGPCGVPCFAALALPCACADCQPED